METKKPKMIVKGNDKTENEKAGDLNTCLN